MLKAVNCRKEIWWFLTRKTLTLYETNAEHTYMLRKPLLNWPASIVLAAVRFALWIVQPIGKDQVSLNAIVFQGFSQFNWWPSV